ncbi:MAG TPA: UDP-N-acetylglucosamine--N-acetylmuramyl-(pentapeptide) pyrophosphoryl-undecaprenol N-acetylglucosamine transferase [Acidimicrobiia bacterium]|nr:UDP-N-acetylglucosamine--N-acetylmuramyl-(pentapeptide) pyrophosphoryl-undecaprenol N-acetylglucosamine transferase [Acidimicrobiia bacterium]
MTYAIAAAGTGGHVFPGLAVGEALVASGIPVEDILFIGGSRLESRVYPEAGFPFLEVEIRGLQRRLTTANLAIPALVARAGSRIRTELRARRAEVVLGMGGYISVPAGFAARGCGAVLLMHEQNAEAGLANRLMSRLAKRSFGSFPTTAGLARAEWVGNPIRPHLARFDRANLRSTAAARYRLEPGRPVVGVFGGSLGAGILNRAAEVLAAISDGGGFSILHLTGSDHLESISAASDHFDRWHTVGFEDRMDYFYAACDLVVARAGGAVAELTATATPAILVPGGFGSGEHQTANADALASVGAAIVVAEADLAGLPSLVTELLSQPERMREMAAASSTLARPDAADVVAGAMRQAHA